MEIIKIVYECIECAGAGEVTHNISPGGPLVTETCAKCGGSGRVESPNHGVIKEYFDTNQTAIMEELDAIKRKVQKIWLKVKDEGDPE